MSAYESSTDIKMVIIPMFVTRRVPQKHSYRSTKFGVAAILDFKMAAILDYIFNLISACESPRGIKLVAIPMFVLPRIS